MTSKNWVDSVAGGTLGLGLGLGLHAGALTDVRCV